MIFASGGYHVSIYDIDEKQVSRALTLIQEKLNRFEKQGCLRGKATAAQQAQLITGHTNLAECVEGACYLQASANLAQQNQQTEEVK